VLVLSAGAFSAGRWGLDLQLQGQQGAGCC
jgi:hypothetical protein